MKTPENYNLLYSELILSEFIHSGIKNFILSPGLRNAPLLIALKKLMKNHQGIKVSSSIDERAAAYMALGQYKECGIPSVLICTSGTAMANYHPGLLEAEYSKCPMIICSADRPLELHLEGANQTMEQVDFFQCLKESTLNLPIQDKTADLKGIMSHVSRYLRKALISKQSFHFNFPFREPLDTTLEEISPETIEQYEKLLTQRDQKEYLRTHETISIKPSDFYNVNGLLIIGELKSTLSPESIEELKKFIELCPWPKVIDVTTSLKYDFNIEDNLFPTFDHPEVYQAFSENEPDLILHLGGKMTSKKYHQFTKDKSIPMIHVDQHEDIKQPFNHVKKSYHVDPMIFIHSFLKQECEFISLRTPNYLEKVRNIILPMVEKKIALIDHGDLSFPKISKKIVEELPNHSTLYLGNSTAIRSFDSYASFSDKKNIKVVSHRGVSGIEGFIAASTAYHQSKEDQFPTVLALGDVSFLHDLNSLSLIKEVKSPFVIVLINNSGGGIFSLVPFKDEYEIMPWMSTPHELQFDQICQSFNIHHQFANDFNQFKNKFREALQENKVTVLEVNLDNQKNLEIYQALKTLRL